MPNAMLLRFRRNKYLGPHCVSGRTEYRVADINILMVEAAGIENAAPIEL